MFPFAHDTIPQTHSFHQNDVLLPLNLSISSMTTIPTIVLPFVSDHVQDIDAALPVGTTIVFARIDHNTNLESSLQPPP